MDFLRAIHGFALPLPIIGQYLVLLTTVLFIVSLFMLFRPGVPKLFVWLLRLNWLAVALVSLSGILLSLLGQKVPSAVAAHVVNGHKVTRYGFLVDSGRPLEHIMYAAFVLLSLYALELLIGGRLMKDSFIRRSSTVVIAFFLVGVAFMAVRTAIYPGLTPGG